MTPSVADVLARQPLAGCSAALRPLRGAWPVRARGDCPRCRHATSDAGPPGWQPARVVEYIERNADGETVAWVNELQPCPWTLCPRRTGPDDASP